MHQKLCQRTLIDWRNINPFYFSKNFDGLWCELINQNIFSESRSNSAILFCLWIYRRKVTWDTNFDCVNGITVTKFSLSKFSVKKLWPSFWRKLWSCKQALFHLQTSIMDENSKKYILKFGSHLWIVKRMNNNNYNTFNGKTTWN